MSYKHNLPAKLEGSLQVIFLEEKEIGEAINKFAKKRFLQGEKGKEFKRLEIRLDYLKSRLWREIFQAMPKLNPQLPWVFNRQDMAVSVEPKKDDRDYTRELRDMLADYTTLKGGI